MKTLPEDFASNPERLARFEREARILASLNHSNLAAVYDLEEQDGARYIVMELVEGESLHSILGRGPLPVEEALRIAVQVTSGIEAAHDAGVIHRDLKPGNIVVTTQGVAKVLDFGLAKEIEGRGSSLDISQSPTATIPAGQSHHTAEGQIVGTAAYLSPEQARGRSLDKRTDVWAFGCVLYEMLTGGSPYAGETATDSLGAILHKDPEWERLPKDTPPTVQLLLRRCLAKDPSRRLRDIGDVRVELEEAIRDPSGTSLNLASAAIAAEGATKRSSPIALLAIVALTIVAGFASWSAWLAPSPAPLTTRIIGELGGEERLLVEAAGPQFAISPDGNTIVYASGSSESTATLYVRSLRQLEATELSGTEGAHLPFFSPDSQWIGFFTGGALKKIAVSGGAPMTLCGAQGDHRGASWGDDGTIIFAPDTQTGLHRVSAAGGEPEILTTPDQDNEERSHRWPWILPGSKAVLFTSQQRGSNFDDATIEALNLTTNERVVIHRGGAQPRYTKSGHVVFGREGRMFAAPFDVSTLQMTASPAPVLEGVRTEPTNGGANFSVSDGGTLVYNGGGIREFRSTLVWSDREGNQTVVDPVARNTSSSKLSPDGSRIAMQIFNEDLGGYDIRIYEIDRQVLSRLTFAPEDDIEPVWSPDGSMIAFASRSGRTSYEIWTQPSDGSEPARKLTDVSVSIIPSDWSPDGRLLVAHRSGPPATRWDIVVVDAETGEVTDFLATEASEGDAQISPDGRWIAYGSDESGQDEVFIRPFPEGGGKWQVSASGGIMPQWSRAGDELFYLNAGKLVSAPIVATESAVQIGLATDLFDYLALDDAFGGQYDVGPGEERPFLLREGDRGDSPEDIDTIAFVFNWFEDLKSQLEHAR